MEKTLTVYDDDFYKSNVASSAPSAQTVYPLIHSQFSPRSVIDFGCGRGTWLNEAHKHGALEVVGLDGVWNSQKQINSSIKFLDLKDHKVMRDRRFDLAISLEVFEHLDLNFCDEIIDTMTRCADAIVFSAAFVNQRGTKHINEQYPSFWAKRFLAKGYCVYDFFRPQIWGNSKVDFCYQQNMFIYVNKHSEIYKNGLEAYKMKNLAFMDCMHPEIYLYRSGRDAILDFKKNLVQVMKKRVFK